MKKYLILSVSLNIILLCIWGAKRIYYSQPQSEDYSADYYDSITNDIYQNLIKINNGDIVFVGNSITLGFPVTELYGPKFKNRGIGANQSRHIKNRIKDIAQGKPAKIFLMTGTNDVRYGQADSVLNNIKNIIRIINSESPDTKIIIQSILPVSGGYAKYNKTIKELNEKIEIFCYRWHITYVNLYPFFAKDGELNVSYTYDGLHLNSNGYRVWDSVIKSFF